MKRFFTFLCALSVLLSVNAAPQSKKDKAEMFAAQKIQKTEVKKVAKKALKNRGSLAKVKKAIAFGDVKLKSAKLAQAPQATKETHNITLGRYGYHNYGGGDIFYRFFSDDEAYNFDFDFLLADTEAEDIELDHTYTLADLWVDYSYIKQNSPTSAYIQYAEVSAVKSLDADGNVLFNATITDENGDIWIISLDEGNLPETPDGGDYVADQVKPIYDSEIGGIQYQLIATSDKLKFYFTISLEEGVKDVEYGKTYTLSDMLTDYSFGLFNSNQYITYTEATFLKKAGENNADTIWATAKDDEGNDWKIQYTYPEKIPQTYDLTATTYDASFYKTDNDLWARLYVGEDYLFRFDVVVPDGETDLVSGVTYTLDDMIDTYTYGSDYNTSSSIQYASATITKTVAADGSFTIAASVLDIDGNTWNISYTQAAPDVKNETLTLNGIAMQGSGYHQIEAANADSTILVCVVFDGESIVGSFVTEDVWNFWSISYVRFGGVEYDVTEADFTIVYDEVAEKYLVTGTLTTVNPEDPTDIIIFTINLTLTGDAPEEPVVIDVPTTITGNFDLEIESGVWYLEGLSVEGAYFGLFVYSDEVAGTFDENDIDDYYTYVAVEDENGDPIYYDYTEGSLNVTYVDGVATITGSITCVNEDDATDERDFDINITATYTIPTERQYDYDEQTEFSQNFPDFDPATDITTEYLDDGYLHISAVNDENASADILVAPFTGETTLVPGTYIVGEEVMPSTGVNSSGYLTYSFVGFLDAEGYYDTVWFLVDGTLVVDDEGIITLNGRNSFNQVIHAVFGKSEEQGIEDIVAEGQVVKVVRNNQIMIMKGDKVYNVLGTVVK